MDLRVNVPRGGYDTLGGLVMAARTTDKCRAFLAGTIGEYNYDCPLDRDVFELLGTNANEFAEVVRRAPDDSGVAAFIQEKLARKTLEEIDAWNKDFLAYEPDTSEAYYTPVLAMREQRAPGRDDITLWVDLTEVEEGRAVPSREDVQATRTRLGLPPR